MECVSPSISFHYELIDYDGSTEIINITDTANRELAICGDVSFGQTCGQFVDCFVNLPLNVTKIGISESYTVGVNVAQNVDALCDDHDYSVNAVLSLSCAAGTTAPTMDPTTPQPTLPTLNPTMTPSISPSLPSYAPTHSPTWSV
jgi:hypothetical protein